jgi:phosphoglycolate phosphatase-like HAD superfamily hydrolase
MRTWITPSRRPAALLAVALAGLAGGLGARLAGADELGDRILALTVVTGLLPLAGAVVRAAADRRQPLDFPAEVTEEPGQGIRGRVGGRLVAVGKAAWAVPGQPVPSWARRLRRRGALEGFSTAFVAVDGRLAGALAVHDPVRPDTARTLRELRRAGMRRVVMVTGDHPDTAETVGAAIGVDAVLAERTPAEKVEAARLERAAGPTVMVGDGVNDAPALAAVDVGVALGRGAPPPPRRPPTWSWWSTGSTGWWRPSGWRGARAASPSRASWPGWACRWRRWARPPPA